MGRKGYPFWVLALAPGGRVLMSWNSGKELVVYFTMSVNIPEDKKASEYLANERTFLAWIRTSIAVISLGFVVAKFGVWMRELVARLSPQNPMHSTGMSLPLGVTMMALGGVLAVLAALHYHFVNQSIDRGEVKANRGLIIFVTTAVAFLAAMIIAYMLLTEVHL